MTTPHDIEEKFWKALKSDRTVMLGVNNAVTPRPMTAHLDGHDGPIWFFTSRENGLVKALGTNYPATLNFESKGHDIFATVRGVLAEDTDQNMIDRLWNPYVAAWFEGGKTDPQLVLLRFDADHAELWLDGSSLLAGIKLLLGSDPKQDYKDKVAKVTF